MEIKTAELLKAIETVLPGTSDKGIIEGSDGITFMKDSLITYNDRISINNPLETDIQSTVVAADLHKIVKGLHDPLLTLKVKKNVLILRSEGTEAGLNMFSNDKILTFIENLIPADLEFLDLPKTFLNALLLCQFTTVNNINDDNNLFYILVEENKISSSDKYRCTEYTLEEEMEGRVLIPRTIVSTILAFKPDGYYFTEKWAYFINEDDAILSCRIKDGTFPDIEALIKKHKTVEDISFPPEFATILPEIIAISDENLDVSKHVTLTFKNGKMICHLRKEKGWVSKKYKIENKELDIEFVISASFLNEILEFTKVLQVGEKTILIETKNVKHLLALPQEI